MLLEGILVLPIYLTMLGALFIVGDLERARNTLQTVERALTWLAADRFSGHGRDGQLRMLAVSEDKETAPVTAYKVAEMKDGNRRAGNTWLDAFMGYAVMKVDVPVWMRLANTQAAAWDWADGKGGEDGLPYKEDYVVPAGERGKADRQYRSFVVRRRGFDAGADYDRGAAGIRLADNVWVNVTTNEPWVSGVGTGLHTMPKAQAPRRMMDYQRWMASWAE